MFKNLDMHYVLYDILYVIYITIQYYTVLYGIAYTVLYGIGYTVPIRLYGFNHCTIPNHTIYMF